MEIEQLCVAFKKEGKKLNRVVHHASKMDKVFNDTERRQLIRLNKCLTDLMSMLRSDIDKGSIMTVKRMIQAFVSEATGVLQMIEQKNNPGKPIQEGFFDKFKKKKKTLDEYVDEFERQCDCKLRDEIRQFLTTPSKELDLTWCSKRIGGTESYICGTFDAKSLDNKESIGFYEDHRLIAIMIGANYSNDSETGNSTFICVSNEDGTIYETTDDTVRTYRNYGKIADSLDDLKSKLKPYDSEFQEGFFGKMWDKAKEKAKKREEELKEQSKKQTPQSSGKSIPEDFPIDKTLFKKILDEIKKETETDAIVLTDFHELKNPKPDDSCAYGKPVYAPVIPKTSNGEEMRFIIQINFADVPHVIPELPTTGILQLWLGPLGRNGQESKVLYYPDTKKPSIADQVSDKVYVSDYLEDPSFGDRLVTLHIGFKQMKESLNPSTDDEINSYEEIFANKWNENDPDNKHTTEDVFKLIAKYPNAFPRWEHPCAWEKIGGYPCFIQREIRDSKYNKDNSVLLLQLNTNDYVITWGDNGYAYLFITKESLKKRDFSKAIFDSQCY